MSSAYRPYRAAEDKGPPPSFDQARNRRQRTRACGLDPDYWYVVAASDALQPGDIKEIVFWRRSIAVYRGQDGVARALENRCAHRQLKLTAGEVQGDTLICQYHGWGYDGAGRCVHIPHELFGRKQPDIRVTSFPVRERYGFVWIFPGDPEVAKRKPLPELPELEGPDAWSVSPCEYVWKAHHSMALDNVSDYTHGWLHRKWQPFKEPKLLDYETVGDSVVLHYDAKIGDGPIMRWFVDRKRLASNKIRLEYDYPYHRSDTDGEIKHFMCAIPMDERTTRVFFILYYKQFRIPGTQLRIPKFLMKPVLRPMTRIIVDPIFQEDAEALELEQEAWEKHWDAPLAELNPIVKAFQELTIRKWREYLERAEGPKSAPRLAEGS